MLPTRKCHKHLFEGKDSTLGAVSALMLFATISNDYMAAVLLWKSPTFKALLHIYASGVKLFLPYGPAQLAESKAYYCALCIWKDAN